MRQQKLYDDSNNVRYDHGTDIGNERILAFNEDQQQVYHTARDKRTYLAFLQ